MTLRPLVPREFVLADALARNPEAAERVAELRAQAHHARLLGRDLGHARDRSGPSLGVVTTLGDLTGQQLYELAFRHGVRPEALEDLRHRLERADPSTEAWKFMDQLRADAPHLFGPR